jgi:hypothetical protein
MQSGAMRDEIVEALRAAVPDPGDMGRVVELADIGARFDDYRTAVGTTYPVRRPWTTAGQSPVRHEAKAGASDPSSRRYVGSVVTLRT